MLELLLQGPYAHFKKVAHDDWRDHDEKNASFSLSSKGYKDFKSGHGGALADLLTKHNLWPKEYKSNKEPTPRTTKRLRKKSPITSPEHQEKPENQTRIDDLVYAEEHPQAPHLRRLYFSNERNLAEEVFTDFKQLLRVCYDNRSYDRSIQKISEIIRYVHSQLPTRDL